MGDRAVVEDTPVDSRRLSKWLSRIWQRSCDRGKWPRTWWLPLPAVLNLSVEDWKKQHDEISKAINKLLLVFIGFCFFCELALGAPDRSLLASDARISCHSQIQTLRSYRFWSLPL